MQPDSYKFEARDLCRSYGHGERLVVAVDRVSLQIKAGQIVSVVGQSGCGKTVLARMLLRLERPSSGVLLFDGQPIEQARDPRVHWRRVQPVFQDPFSAFNQFFTIRSQLEGCFRLLERRPPRAERAARVDQALRAVSIEPREIAGKYPFELSGGQMQRMLLARIFILRPQVLIADEPTSMVDACSRAGIVESLLQLQRELSMTIVLVTHDLGLARHVSDRLFIMHEGRIVEQGPPDQVIEAPTSEITRRLLADIPQLHRPWIARASKLPVRPAREESVDSAPGGQRFVGGS
jgi:peptide/nickel transport system ATP-binding protein